MYGDGKQVRDWLYVEDHCSAIDLVLRRGTPGETYNVGSGDERSIAQVADAVLAATGAPSALKSYVEDRPGHDRRYSIDCAKLGHLGWQPRIAFDEGLAQTVAWYRDNPGWWQKIKSGEYRRYYEQQYEGIV